MYERKGGMGWSEIPWHSSSAVICEGGTFDACVTDHPDDQEWARLHNCEQASSWFGFGGPRRCTTAPPNNNPGTVHCCHRGVITEEIQRREELEQYGVAPGGRVCESRRTLRGNMRNDRQIAIWSIQDRLCRMGFDPGPVDGTTRSPMLLSAIHQLQRQNQIPEGPIDQATLLIMGLPQGIESTVALTSIGRTGAATIPSSPGVIVAAIGAAGFLGYAIWQYAKKRR
jgi:hypothetical protein